MLAAKGILGGDPQKIYSEMSAKWAKKTLDYIYFVNDTKNIDLSK
jgi:hypothetical protein